MSNLETAMAIMTELFSKDCVFALATSSENKPSVRMIDTYYKDGAFYAVTFANSMKVKELETSEKVALCNQAYRFDGIACNIGHPLKSENSDIREKLIQVFEPWYFRHNNEKDETMCYIKVELQHGFFYKDGMGYKVNFTNNTVEIFPFTFDIVLPT